ncbi:uncharacterized protein LOC112568286 [Pomacea canaliculata]|uniref:uncharacterized protein LOC112568286 n=1 Tax=Pomacea canaliculata TaxID=400727 RepID=UPI000D72848C|nr:uncharacterized protein LOC112568286 [Pomacea canaliculata]
MTTTHRLMAAAFYLCGLLFLYHIDSVKSLKCKLCDFDNNDCTSGNLPDGECPPNHLCGHFREFTKGGDGPDVTLRGCTEGAEGFSCTKNPDSDMIRCVLICAEDNCNSKSYLGEE